MSEAMSSQGSTISWRERLENLALQFRGLDSSHPEQWPVLPRLLCGLCAASAVVIAGWWFIWTGQVEALDAGQALEQQQKTAFEIKVRQAQSLEVLRAQKIQVQAQVNKLEQQLPNKAEMDALLSDINQAGIGRGLQFELFKPGQVQLRDYYAELPIDIKLSGSYHALAAFTSDIAQLPRIVTIDKLNMVSQREGIQTFEAVARTFRYLDNEEVALQKKQQADNKNRGRK